MDEWRGEVEGARRDAEDARRAEEEGRQVRFLSCFFFSLLSSSREPRLMEATAAVAQLLDDKEADVEELSRRVEQLLQQVAEKEAELAAEEEEVEALTHDLQKVRPVSSSLAV